MSIADNLERIIGAKASIRNKIQQKGVAVPASAKIDVYPQYIEQIDGGGGGGYTPAIPVGMSEDWATIVFGDNPKAIQFGTSQDLDNFAQSCGVRNDYLNLSIGTQPRDKVLAMYIGADCAKVPNNTLTTPIKVDVTTQFNNLKLIDFGNCTAIGHDVLSGNPRFTGEIKFSDSLTSIGDNFMSGDTDFSYHVELPDALVSVGRNFMHGCDNLPSIYVPENAKPPTDRNTLSCDHQNALAYRSGIQVSGPGAAKWCTTLPNRDTIPFRKLVFNASGKTYYRTRIQFGNYKADEVLAIEDGHTIPEPKPSPTYISWYYEQPIAASKAQDTYKLPIYYKLDGYTKNEDPAHEVTVEFENGMLPQTVLVDDGETIKARFNLNNSPVIPFSDGRKFVGWFKGEPAEIAYHRVEIDPNNGEIPRATQIAHGYTAWQPVDPKREGDIFVGWSDEEVPIHTVTYEMPDETITRTVPDGFETHPVPCLVNETEEGIFLGWEVVGETA